MDFEVVVMRRRTFRPSFWQVNNSFGQDEDMVKKELVKFGLLSVEAHSFDRYFCKSFLFLEDMVKKELVKNKTAH